MKPLNIATGDRLLYNSMFVMEHFFGRRTTEKLVNGRRERLMQRMLEGVAQRGEGRAIAIDRREGLSRTEFVHDYAQRGKPVVFRGAARQWPCVKSWNFEFLRDRYGDDKAMLVDDKGTPPEFSTLRDVIDNINQGGGKYARFHPLLQRHPELLQDLDLSWLKQFRYRNWLNWLSFYKLFIGGAGTTTRIHNAINDFLFVQIEGRKRWLFYPIEYTCVLDVRANRAPYKDSDLDPSNPDHQRYPMYKYVDYYEVTLEPGDVLYGPPYMWHYVSNPTSSIGLACRWTSLVSALQRSPMFAMLELFNTRPNVIRSLLMTLDDFNKVLALKSADAHAKG